MREFATITLPMGFTERGNTALMREDDGASVIFRELAPSEDGKPQFFQAAYTPGNYPKWEIGVIELTKDELVEHIREKLSAWTVLKNNLTEDALLPEDDEEE